jgi:hypothetical protein
VIAGYNVLLDPDKLDSVPLEFVVKHIERKLSPPDLRRCPIGDGNAALRISKLLVKVSEGSVMLRGLKVVPMPEKLYYIPHIASDGFISFDAVSGLPTAGGGVKISRTPSHLSIESLKEFMHVEWDELDK